MRFIDITTLSPLQKERLEEDLRKRIKWSKAQLKTLGKQYVQDEYLFQDSTVDKRIDRYERAINEYQEDLAELLNTKNKAA